MQARIQLIGMHLRPGALLGLIVSVVVGAVGLVQLDQRLMIIGLFAGPTILMLNAVYIAVRSLHAKNTSPCATYVSAEEMVRLQHLKASRDA